MNGATGHGGAPRGWLEFSANLNPHGTPEDVREAVGRASYGEYADLDTRAAERHLAEDAGVDPEAVLLVSGATEALRLVVGALLEPGDAAIALGPTYGEYARLVAVREGVYRELRAREPAFAPNAAEWTRELATGRYALSFACDPNNPTGVSLAHDDLRAACDALPPATHLVIDQSFAPFASDPVPAREFVGSPRVIVVRSLTKLLAAPGLRVGYVIATPDVLERLRAIRDPWPVSAHACAAASVARWSLSAAQRGELVSWRALLVTALSELDLETTASDAPFVLVRVGGDAEALVRGLARRRIAVRWCGSFGLPEHVRLAVRPPVEQRQLLAALRELRAPVAS